MFQGGRGQTDVKEELNIAGNTEIMVILARAIIVNEEMRQETRTGSLKDEWEVRKW